MKAPVNITLADKYELTAGAVLMSGTQALVRLPLMQRRRDEAVGMRTAGFISGYRGSPLGGYDRELWRAKSLLERHDILFKPAVNEDLAATAIWGTQQLGQFPSEYAGVFSLWYGKGPGVERSGDALKHGNYSGTAPNGGVLVVCGDDHAAKSSSIAHQSEQSLAACSIPVLYPSSVGEIVEYGLAGWALSRFSGLWVGLKCVNETLETDATTPVEPTRPVFEIPPPSGDPDGGVNNQGTYGPTRDDILVTRHRLPRAKLFARLNRLDRTVFATRSARLGIVTAGKAYADVHYALHLLGIDRQRAQVLQLEIYKVGMIWPLEEHGLRSFAAGLAEILVVEEKRPFLEGQAAVALYELADRPRIVGKYDEQGRALLPADLSLSPTEVAMVIAERLCVNGLADEALRNRLAELQLRVSARPISNVPDRPNANQLSGGNIRTPYFCSGCPHNSSTRLPEGSKAFAGIGCHTMVLRMGRETLPPTHMGGEGANWIGIHPFTRTPHVFQNLGDGTYFHSGLLAIRAAVAAQVPITYKILYNGVVAMTGGQPIDGSISVTAMARQVLAEGVKECVVVSDTPLKYTQERDLPESVTVYSRDDLDAVQRRLREVPGVTVLIYEQMCAAEKRRRIKRGRLPEATRRVFVNAEVCEGCGDCSVQSNCVSIRPKETPLGRKRTIDQSTCNEDLSCVKGFCPSFVIATEGQLQQPDNENRSNEPPRVPLPLPASLTTDRYNVVVTGIGGTGVVTIGAVLAMAAHIEGKSAATYNMTGLAQKGGPVYSHLCFANTSEPVLASRVDLADADLIIACDLLSALTPEALQTVRRGHTRAVVNSGIEPSAALQLFPDAPLPGNAQLEQFASAVGPDRVSTVDATAFANELSGDTIAANMLMVGYAFQKGLLPLKIESILGAIELNGVAIDFNRRALELGRGIAEQQRPGAERPPLKATGSPPQTLNLNELIKDRHRRLADYQDARYADRYRERVLAVREAEQKAVPGSEAFTMAVAHNYARLLAYKDEYEVARLYSGAEFRDQVSRTFAGQPKLTLLLAPPTLFKWREGSVPPRKRQFGPWIFVVLRMLAGLKRLRGTPLDVFGYTEDRRLERQLVTDYEGLLDQLLARLSPTTHSIAVKLASIPEQIRGFGHVKSSTITQARAAEASLLQEYRKSVQLEGHAP